MHRFYFPACPVEGPTEPPVSFGHGGIHGSIPKKCGDCEHSFEGSCTRFFDEVQRYMHLDYGPCGIDGPTDPVVYEDEFITAKVEVPRKCAGCRFLVHDSIAGFTCHKDRDKWGDFRRGLDWEAWSPDQVYVELPHPKLTTRALVNCAHDEDLKGFVVEYRRINPGLSMNEAREDFARIRRVLESR